MYIKLVRVLNIFPVHKKQKKKAGPWGMTRLSVSTKRLEGSFTGYHYDNRFK